VEQAYVAFGFPTPPAVHPDQEPLDVLSTVLGEGRSSHLVRVLREEKKLAYSVSASNLTHEGPGLFAVFAECSPAKRSRFFLAFEDLLKAFARHRLTEAELRRAKNMIENSWLQGMETYHSQASALGLFALEDDLERLRNYLSRIRSLTRGQLDRVIERYFMPNRFSSVVIEP
jgi:predicted Zn-dependent peptidase